MSKISKHQAQGKHSLGYDVIFKGKKEVIDENEHQSTNFDYAQDSFQYDPGSPVHDEVYNNIDTERKRKITEKVYNTIKEKTDVNMDVPRRKPSKVAFNKYYALLKKELKDDGFSNVEIFNELAVYFSDNLMSIFKLLDNKWRNLIIQELHDHIGKVTEDSKVVNVKNLKEGAEIEFKYYDDIDDENKIITGIVLSYDSDDKQYKVDSFENIYFVEIQNIMKILNNRNYKYNLNKLNNIDFL